MSEKLRAEMKLQNVKAREVALAAGIDPTNFSRKMNGDRDWRLGECYAVLDYLELPRARLPYYFPPKERSE